jgi:hypothetical protein
MKNAHMRLVANHGQRVRHPRPVVTDYPGATHPANSCTPQAAIVSAVKRLVNGDYNSATVSDKQGRVLANLTKGRFYVNIAIRKRGVLK